MAHPLLSDCTILRFRHACLHAPSIAQVWVSVHAGRCHHAAEPCSSPGLYRQQYWAVSLAQSGSHGLTSSGLMLQAG